MCLLCCVICLWMINIWVGYVGVDVFRLIVCLIGLLLKMNWMIVCFVVIDMIMLICVLLNMVSVGSIVGVSCVGGNVMNCVVRFVDVVILMMVVFGFVMFVYDVVLWICLGEMVRLRCCVVKISGLV